MTTRATTTTRTRRAPTPATTGSPAMPRKRRTPKAPPSGHWDGDTYVCAPTDYEQKRVKQGDSPAAVLKRAQATAARTRWEDQLWRDIHAAHLPEPARQYLFHPTRRYRADFAFIPERLIVEVQGGVWVAGRHNRAQGYEDDCRRTADALEHGWRILPVTPDMVASGEAVARIERVLAAIWQAKRRTRSGGAA